MNNRKFLIILTFCVPVFLASMCQEPTPGPPDAGLYHTYSEVRDTLQQFERDFPGIAQVTILGRSVENRDILAIRISDNPGVDEDEPKILFVGGHHAREWISVDVPLLLARYLLEGYAGQADIRSLVDNGEIWVIPLLNPDGHQYSVSSNRLWRKNRRNNGDGSFGVDLNRNYSYEWGGSGSSGDTFSETYRGPVAFSEPETQIIRDLSNQNNFGASVSYHNFSQLVLFPWGYTNSPAPDEALLQQLATTMADKIRSVNGKNYVPQQSSALYVASGDATDWLYGEKDAPSFTIELRPRSSSPGFLLPENEIQPTFEENLPAALFLIEWTQNGGSLVPTL